MTDDDLTPGPDPTPDRVPDLTAGGDPALERRLRGALAVLADDVPPPRPPDLPRFAAVRRRRRTGAAAAVLVAAVALPLGWSASGPLRSRAPVASTGPVEVAGVLTVTCRPGRTEVDADHVEVSADGVHLRVLNQSGDPTTWLDHSVPESEPYGYDRGNSAPLAGAVTELVAQVAPPVMEVSCAGGNGGRRTPAVRVRLDDPYRLYRRVDVDRVLGCAVNGIADGPGHPGNSLRQAAERAGASVTGGVRLVEGPGYRRARDSAVYLGVGDKNRVVIVVNRDADGRYLGYPENFCAPGSWRS